MTPPGGCEPEESTLPSVTVSQIFSLSLFSLSLFCHVTFLQEGIIIEFWNLPWGFKSQKIRFGVKTNLRGPQCPLRGWFFRFKKTKRKRLKWRECADPGARTPIGASGNFIYGDIMGERQIRMPHPTHCCVCIECPCLVLQVAAPATAALPDSSGHSKTVARAGHHAAEAGCGVARTGHWVVTCCSPCHSNWGSPGEQILQKEEKQKLLYESTSHNIRRMCWR